MRNKLKQKMSSYNYVNNFKFHIIAPLVIAFVAIIVLACCNFNLGYDFSGGTTATVIIKEDLSKSSVYRKVEDKIDDILSKNHINNEIYQITQKSYYQFSDFGNSVTVTFNKVSEEKCDKIQKDLVATFHSNLTEDADKEIAVTVDTFSGSATNNAVLMSVVGMILVAVLLAFYFGFRFSVSAAFLSITMFIINVLVSMSVIAITRVSFEMSTLAVIGFAGILSMLFSSNYFIWVKKNQHLDKYLKHTNADLANLSVVENMCFYLKVSCMLLITLFVLACVSTPILASNALACLLCVLVVLYSQIALLPKLFALFYVKRAVKVKTVETKKATDKKLDEYEEAVEIIKEEEVKEN